MAPADKRSLIHFSRKKTILRSVAQQFFRIRKRVRIKTHADDKRSSSHFLRKKMISKALLSSSSVFENEYAFRI